MKLDYKQKEVIMQEMFKMHKTPDGYRSTWKGVPIYNYEVIKEFIDFTKYYVMFRGPRPHDGNSNHSTRKCNAHSFDVYQRDNRNVREMRIERAAFRRGVEYGRV